MSSRVLFVSIVLTCLVVPAGAGSPPTTSTVTPGSVAASCLALGAKGESIANGTGCRNTRTGAAVVCSNDQCTDYFADPRHAKIKAILDAEKKKPRNAPIKL